jgi:hypothetical protein
MKTRLIGSLLFLALSAAGQTAINQSVAVLPGQKINMHFDYPELIRVSTWDKNEISITGSVSINNGENDDAFELETGTSGNVVDVRCQIRNMKSLPQRITIHRHGQKIMFRTKADYKKYAEENGQDYSNMSWGIDMDITLDIKVPKNAATKVESVYGMVEVKDFAGPLMVEATYGGVDAALLESQVGELKAETNYGQIYTNLKLAINSDNMNDENFHTEVTARPGTGPSYSFESKYGNVYLRRKDITKSH